MMTTSFASIKPCRRALSLPEIEVGLATVQENAARLVRDAKILLHARRHSTAAMLAAMAIVEISRIPALLELSTATNETSVRKAWQEFRREAQSFPWAVLDPDQNRLSEKDLDGLVAFAKSVGAAVECVAPGVWLNPDDVITRELAKQLVTTAEMFRSRPLDPRGVRVWVDVVNSLPRNAPTERVLRVYQGALAKAGLSQPVADIATFAESIAEN